MLEMFYDKGRTAACGDGDFSEQSIGMRVFIFVMVDDGVDFALTKLRR